MNYPECAFFNFKKGSPPIAINWYKHQCELSDHFTVKQINFSFVFCFLVFGFFLSVVWLQCIKKLNPKKQNPAQKLVYLAVKWSKRFLLASATTTTTTNIVRIVSEAVWLSSCRPGGAGRPAF